ncbi:TolC family protein, partial [Chlamydiales bacterium]|nr:TolC family protein [Chlamydiales bacterium]
MNRYILFLALLAGCQQHLDIGHDLETPTPLQYKNEPVCKNPTPITTEWWLSFEDPTLNHLEIEAIENNQDLWAACGRIMEAKALAGIAFSDRVPHLGLNANWAKQQKLLTLADLGAGSKNIRVIQQEYQFPLGLSYELDLWGKFKHGNQAACERYFATQSGYTALYISLTSEVATQYLTLRTLDE